MALQARGSVAGVPLKCAVRRLDDGLDRARIVEGTDWLGAPKNGPMEKLRVVFKGYGKVFQARSGGVVVSAEDVVGALVKADGPMKRDSWSAMVMLRRPECEPVTVWFSRTVGALLKP